MSKVRRRYKPIPVNYETRLLTHTTFGALAIREHRGGHFTVEALGHLDVTHPRYVFCATSDFGRAVACYERLKKTGVWIPEANQ